MASPIPQQAWQAIQAFLADRKTGSVRLDIKDGQICAWTVTETRHVKH